jgi:hypothetical protein
MKRGAEITDLSPEVFMLIVDRLLPMSEDGERADALDFACLRLSSRGVRQLCDAAVRRLDLRHRSRHETQYLLRRFTGVETEYSSHTTTWRTSLPICTLCGSCHAAMAHADRAHFLQTLGHHMPTDIHARCRGRCPVLAGTEGLVLRPSCSLAGVQLAVLQPLTILRSLQLPCAFAAPALQPYNPPLPVAPDRTAALSSPPGGGRAAQYTIKGCR